MNGRLPKSPETRVRVTIFAQQQLVRESLQHLIDNGLDMSVNGTYDFGVTSIDLESLGNSDVAVLYLNNGASVDKISIIRNVNPEIRIVVITHGDDLEAQTEALRLGAVGIVKAEQSAKLLIEAIRQTFRGETWLNQTLLNKLLESDKPTAEKRTNGARPTGIESLTAREIEVIEMIGLGLKSKAIASRMFISEATVRHHLSSIYGKLGVDDRLNLVIYAYRNGLVRLSNEVAEK